MQYLYYLLLRYILIIAPCLARPDGVGRDMGVHLVLSVERDDDACHVDCAAISSYIYFPAATHRSWSMHSFALKIMRGSRTVGGGRPSIS